MKERLTVLAIDDLPDSLNLIVTLLGKILPQAQVLTAGDGQQGIRLAAQHRPDLILLDVVMPELDGFAVCRKLKSRPETSRIPLLLISGRAVDEGARRRGIELGADGYLCKPFEIAEFATQIKVLLRVKQNEDALLDQERKLERALEERTCELERSRALYRAIVEDQTELICRVRSDGTLSFCNLAFRRFFGLPADGDPKVPFVDLIDAEGRTLMAKALQSTLSPGDTLNPQTSSATPEGRTRWVQWTLRSIQDGHGRPEWQAVGRDVSDLRVAEREIAEGRERFLQLAERVRVIPWEADASTLQFLQVGPQAGVILGYPAEEWLRPGFWPALAHPDDAAWASSFRRESMDLGDNFEFEYRALSRDGRTVWIHEIVNVVRDAGASRRLRGFLIDVTDRKQAEAELGRLASAIEQSAESILITDTAGTIQYVNSGFERVTGYSREEVIGRNPRLLKSGRMPEEEYRRLWHTLEAGGTWQGRFINRRKDGQLYEIEQTISPMRDAEGRIVSYVSVSLDITQRTQLEAELRQAQKMESIGRLAGGIAHDFNNLLTTILGVCEFMLDRLPETHELRSEVESVLFAGQRAAKLTRQLLALGRKQLAQMHPLVLKDILLDMDKLLRRTIGEDIEMITVLDEDSGCILGDTGLIEQVVMNLAVNARDAMPRGGKLTITCTGAGLDEAQSRRHVGVAPGNYVLLSFKDTGVGMTPEVKEHLFEPFFTTKAPGKGTGLGLSTVYGIVRQLNGFIEVHSEPDQGAEFRLYLPRLPLNVEVMSRRESTVSPPGGTERILLVEDEDSVRGLAERILSSLGYSVTSTRNGEDALRVFEQQQGAFDLVFTDVVMPQMGGTELARSLRTRNPALKILFTSGFTEGTYLSDRGIGTDTPLLLKPFNRSTLAQKVRDVLDS